MRRVRVVVGKSLRIVMEKKGRYLIGNIFDLIFKAFRKGCFFVFHNGAAIKAGTAE